MVLRSVGGANAVQCRVDQVVEFLSRLSRLTGDTLQFVPARVIADEASSWVILSRVKAHRSGRDLDTDAVHIVTAAHGEVLEIWLFHSDQELVDGFWTEEVGQF